MFPRILTSVVASPLRSLLLPLVGVGLLSGLWITGCGKSDLKIDGAGLTGNPASAQTMSDAAGAPVSHIPSIAVIDVNAVAQQVGMLDQLNALVKEREQQAQQKFVALQSQLTFQYQQAEQFYQEEETSIAQAQLATLQQQHMSMLNTQWSNLQAEISNYHRERKSEFLGMVRPMAFAVAKSKGMTMVLTTNQVFSVDEQADITSEVAQKMLQVATGAQQPPIEPVNRTREIGPFRGTVAEMLEAAKR